MLLKHAVYIPNHCETILPPETDSRVSLISDNGRTDEGSRRDGRPYGLDFEDTAKDHP